MTPKSFWIIMWLCFIVLGTAALMLLASPPSAPLKKKAPPRVSEAQETAAQAVWVQRAANCHVAQTVREHMAGRRV
jgi:hypothetical protein